ncbi:hypothetical protein, unlikely [Trypanosoma brucei gambiense DAL972]|uniref:Uncharacterized protein n=1 Tax=Trypanosoma brucei gambiense (strain MHOM/CI/86/DAL972) TaxID=679716 RepID=C9ZSL4_TRYB9|nr:hypothetical protein, unlikely [Trypanosoma brucei gambiense DAL972]CBH12398.1 hypothetical protein, unlikely [Trypanosoma brucei gambiense DAL972]|eukprot:XP_011774679.1 hypothetical protein, unlikely [Trypanosoma brucei gambiense DAL972]
MDARSITRSSAPTVLRTVFHAILCDAFFSFEGIALYWLVSLRVEIKQLFCWRLKRECWDSSFLPCYALFLYCCTLLWRHPVHNADNVSVSDFRPFLPFLIRCFQRCIAACVLHLSFIHRFFVCFLFRSFHPFHSPPPSCERAQMRGSVFRSQWNDGNRV